jgi:hypothetical protein
MPKPIEKGRKPLENVFRTPNGLPVLVVMETILAQLRTFHGIPVAYREGERYRGTLGHPRAAGVP